MARSRAKYPLTGFSDYLRANGASESTARQVVVAIRRALAHLGPEHLEDAEELELYLESMPKATKSVFRHAWKKLRGYTEASGALLPDLPRRGRVHLPHPLWADVADLQNVFTSAALSQLRWGSIQDRPELIPAARRIFTYITGRDPELTDVLIPRRADALEPMPEWMIEVIFRSDAQARKSDVGDAAVRVLERLTRLNVTAAQLRQIWDRVTILRGSRVGRSRIEVGCAHFVEAVPSGSRWDDVLQEMLMARIPIPQDDVDDPEDGDE